MDTRAAEKKIKIMDETKNHKALALELIHLLYQKGYRRTFTLVHPGTNHPDISGTLNDCLDKFLVGYRLDDKRWDKLQLSTLAPYNDHLTCTLQLQFDEAKGFLIRELTIEDKVSREQRYYRLSNNQQVPGAGSIEGLFPKPKPWDDIAKGKFRLKR